MSTLIRVLFLKQKEKWHGISLDHYFEVTGTSIEDVSDSIIKQYSRIVSDHKLGDYKKCPPIYETYYAEGRIYCTPPFFIGRSIYNIKATLLVT